MEVLPMKTATHFPTRRSPSRHRRHLLLRPVQRPVDIRPKPRRLKRRHVLAYDPAFLRIVVLLAEGNSCKAVAERLDCHHMAVVRVCYWLGLFFGTHTEELRALENRTVDGIRGYLEGRRVAKLARA